MSSADHLFYRSKKPLVLGHRGVPVEHQENTLSGFRRALEIGADGVELDVLISKDGKLVVFHDDSLERLTGHTASVADLSWSAIKNIPIKSYINQGGKMIDYGKADSICLLEEVLEDIGGKLIINIELKGRHSIIGSEVARLVHKMGLVSDVFATSFHFSPLLALRRQSQEIQCGFAFTRETDLSRKLKQRLYGTGLARKLIGARLASVNIDMLNQNSIAKYRHKTEFIGTWTLFSQDRQYFDLPDDEPSQTAKIKQLQDANLDFMITDDPLRLKQLLEKL